MGQWGYRKLLAQAEYQTLHGSHGALPEAGVRYLPQAGDAYREVAEDRERQVLQWRLLKEAWKEPFRPTQEPVRDEAKALERLHWCLSAFLLAAIEVAFAFWFASTYLEIPVLPAERLQRALVLTVPGVLLAAASGLLFHKQMALHDDEKRPRKTYRRFARLAALSSATGLGAIGAFLLTRSLLSGGQVLVAGLGVPTLGLAAGMAASLRCAEILHRPNRVVARYDASSRLLDRLERLLEQGGNQEEKAGDGLTEGEISQS